MDSHDVTFYVQVEPTFGRWTDRTGKHPVAALRAVAMNKNTPRSPRGGTVLVKLTLRIPDTAFYPLRPEAVIVIPEEMTLAQPLEVMAADPHQGDHASDEDGG